MDIIKKLKDFFRKIFYPQKRIDSHHSEKTSINNKSKEEFLDFIQKDVKINSNKQQILDDIDKNPDLINYLSYNRLVQLNQLYAERISELEHKIKRLKSKINY